MATALVSARARAYLKQNHLCCYCETLMWETDPQAFAQAHGLTLRQAKLFQSTGEHLVAHQDGGGLGCNIAAACLFCNRARHQFRAQSAPDALSYGRHVRRRLAAGRWFSFPIPSSMNCSPNVTTARPLEPVPLRPESVSRPEGFWLRWASWAAACWNRMGGVRVMPLP